jgi:hypothetical protein
LKAHASRYLHEQGKALIAAGNHAFRVPSKGTNSSSQQNKRRFAVSDAIASYDYVIVGAGSAGCVLAARLSEDPGNKVLLLEAGPPDRSVWIHLPIGYGKTMWSPQYNWRFETDPDPNMNGRRIYWPRARPWVEAVPSTA